MQPRMEDWRMIPTYPLAREKKELTEVAIQDFVQKYTKLAKLDGAIPHVVTLQLPQEPDRKGVWPGDDEAPHGSPEAG